MLLVEIAADGEVIYHIICVVERVVKGQLAALTICGLAVRCVLLHRAHDQDGATIIRHLLKEAIRHRVINLLRLHAGVAKGPCLLGAGCLIFRHLAKQHKDVLRAIRNLECSSDFNERNFAPVEFIDEFPNITERRIEYHMTRDGFTFLVMGFTGKEAAIWKEKYIAAFNAMEQRLRASQMPAPMADLSDPGVLLPLLTSYAQRTQVAEGRVRQGDAMDMTAQPFDVLITNPPFSEVIRDLTAGYRQSDPAQSIVVGASPGACPKLGTPQIIETRLSPINSKGAVLRRLKSTTYRLV